MFLIIREGSAVNFIIVNALKSEGNIFVKPSASLAKIFEAVPNATAAIKNV